MTYSTASKMKQLLLFLPFLLLAVKSCGDRDSNKPPPNTPSNPTRFIGIASFAAMHPQFPCDRWLEPYKRAAAANKDFGPAMVILWNTFGEEPYCAARFMEEFKNRPHVLEIHFSNEPCRRNKRCRDGEFRPEWSVSDYNQRLERDDSTVYGAVAWRMEKIESFITAWTNANTKVLISRGLEDNFTAKAAARMNGILRKLTAQKLVSNPLNERDHGDLDYRETHKLNRDISGANCIANQDGNFGQTPEQSRDFLRRYSHCEVAFLWPEKLQGLTREGEPFVAPRTRRFEISDREIDVFSNLLIEASHG